jgi:hypothetical protein
MFSTDAIFSLNVFDLCLVESIDAESKHVESQLYIHNLITINSQ